MPTGPMPTSSRSRCAGMWLSAAAPRRALGIRKLATHPVDHGLDLVKSALGLADAYLQLDLHSGQRPDVVELDLAVRGVLVPSGLTKFMVSGHGCGQDRRADRDCRARPGQDLVVGERADHPACAAGGGENPYRFENPHHNDPLIPCRT